MKKTLTVGLGLLLIAGVVAAQVVSNIGTTPTGEKSDNVLRGAGGILYAPSEADDAAFRAAVAAASGGVVDYFDARAATPSVALMDTYQCVVTWTNFAYSDNVAFGDNLATFNDNGGSVVLGVFTTYTSGNFLAGAIMTPAYSPVVGGSNHFAMSNYAGDGTTSIHNGVAAYECTFRDILALQGAGAQDGSYVDGEIAHAYNPDFSVVYSNGSGDVALGCTGDWALLVANSCAAIVPVTLQSFDIE